jgi:hypothetical protein
MERPPEILKSFANRTARTALSPDGAELARLLRLAGFLAPPSPVAADGSRREERSVAAPDPDNIGIWGRRIEEGKVYFVRRQDTAAQWHFWANLGRIGPKEGKRRVVLLGESVARGFLYDPQFTPAMALEMTLQSNLGKGEVEVIDLARTDLGLEALIDLACSVRALEPDALVIFAGNNWHSCTERPEDILDGIATLHDGGIRGLKQSAESKLAGNVKRLLKTVASAYEDTGVPVVWVIPEYNLADWRDPETNAPWLAGEANKEWLSCWRGARGALSKGDLNAALQMAGKMVDLDGGVSGTGLYILAECHQKLGDRDAARRCLELARDALIWEPSITISPRPYSVVQETIRREADAHGHEVVDLPQVFREYLKGDLPDRRVLIDYCHLTALGMRVAMAATASRLLRAFKSVEIDWALLAREPVKPEPEVEAGALLLAAIHNAHWGQPYELVHYYCSRAIEASPKMAQVMVRLIDMQTRRAPIWMCRSSEQITSLSLPLIQRYLFRFNHQLLDRTLLDAAVDSLKKIGVSAREQLDKLRRDEHSVKARNIDLLRPYYCRVSPQQRELGWKLVSDSVGLARNDYYRAYGSESRFYFIGEAGCPVRLRLTCRLPDASSSQEAISLDMNGRRVGESVIGGRWDNVEQRIEGDVVRNGVNEVVIRWPLPEFRGEKAIQQASDDLLAGVTPEFFPVFGEIHSFIATALAQCA